MCTVGRCIMYTRIRLLLLIHPFISSFFFLSNFQTLKFFVTLFSESRKRRRLKLVTHMDNGWMYRVYRNHDAALICPFMFPYFFIFLSLQISSFKKNVLHTFLRSCEACKIETWYAHGQWADVSFIPESGSCFLCYTCEQWVDVLCIPESDCCCLFISIFLFLSNFQTLKILSHFSQELYVLES